MIFQDNVIKEYLKNAYFISGTPCGGKTTISRELAKRHNVFVYDIDERFSHHQKISNPTFQPSMNKVFNDADAFFGRTVEEYKEWLIDNTYVMGASHMGIYRLGNCICGNGGWSNCWYGFYHESRLLSIT